MNIEPCNVNRNSLRGMLNQFVGYVNILIMETIDRIILTLQIITYLNSIVFEFINSIIFSTVLIIMAVSFYISTTLKIYRQIKKKRMHD
jgi:energy-converting hydrogenase Eha subunit A